MSLYNDDLVLWNLALHLPVNSIVSYCQSSKRLNELICNNNYFWEQKFIQDYGPIDYNGKWKDLYINFQNVWVFGYNYSGKLGLGVSVDIVENSNGPIQIPYRKAKKVSVRSNHALILDLYDNIWSFGSNIYGQLGVNDSMNKETPIMISNLKAKEISAGASHSIVIDLNNNVWGFGSNDYGQLGLEGFNERKIPKMIEGITAKKVSAGYYNTMIIDLNDDVFIFGLVLANIINKPTRIPFIKGKEISSGPAHAIIDLNNNVWTFGDNRFGQLGLSDYIKRQTPVMIPNLKAKQISSGRDHTIVIDMQNNVWSFGLNNYGQLGLGDYNNRNAPSMIKGIKAKQVSAGYNYTMLIDINYIIWGFGDNSSGQLGWGDGWSDTRKVNIPTKISNMRASQVSAGSDSTIMIGTNVDNSS